MSSSRQGRGHGGRARRGGRGPRRPAGSPRPPAAAPPGGSDAAPPDETADAPVSPSAAGGASGGGDQDEGGRRRGPGGGRLRPQRGGRPTQPETRAGFRLPGWVWWVGGGGAIAAVVVIVAVLQGTSSGANAGDHWHAALNIQVCDDDSYEFPYFNGGVHSHGDGLIHLHPTSSDEAGDNASLATFFRNAAEAVPSFALTEDSIQVDNNIEYRDGDLCNDGSQGRLAVTINGEERDDFMSYLPQEGDRIAVRFR